MKAYYREIQVGFVLELRQILLLTAAIFVPQLGVIRVRRDCGLGILGDSVT